MEAEREEAAVLLCMDEDRFGFGFGFGLRKVVPTASLVGDFAGGGGGR